MYFDSGSSCSLELTILLSLLINSQQTPLQPKFDFLSLSPSHSATALNMNFFLGRYFNRNYFMKLHRFNLKNLPSLIDLVFSSVSMCGFANPMLNLYESHGIQRHKRLPYRLMLTFRYGLEVIHSKSTTTIRWALKWFAYFQAVFIQTYSIQLKRNIVQSKVKLLKCKPIRFEQSDFAGWKSGFE